MLRRILYSFCLRLLGLSKPRNSWISQQINSKSPIYLQQFICFINECIQRINETVTLFPCGAWPWFTSSLLPVLYWRSFLSRLAWVVHKNGEAEAGNYDYVADLDSVYKDVEGGYVYGLFKNKGDSVKNSYVFFVIVELLDRSVEEFCWPPFLLKTKPTKRWAILNIYTKFLRKFGWYFSINLIFLFSTTPIVWTRWECDGQRSTW